MMRERALGLAAFALLAGCQQVAAGGGAAAPMAAATSAAATAAATRSAALPAQVCAAGETPLFACTLRDEKRVAVCGTAPGKAEYRFGGETTELVLAGGERANVPYSGGSESQLAFTNGGTRYIVFSRMVRTGFGPEGNNPAISDGVVVERGGKFLAIKLCDDPDVKPVDVTAAPKGSGGMELFTEETIRADPPGE
jgi:hypothetical protein